jgi:hypothetical protein
MHDKNSTARVITEPFGTALADGYTPCISCMSNYDVESAIRQFGDPSRALLTYCLDKALVERTPDAMRLCANKILYDLRVAGFTSRGNLEDRLPEWKMAYKALRAAVEKTPAIRDEELNTTLDKIRDLGQTRQDELRK